MKKIQLTGGVWSATPTPLNAAGRVDIPSVERLVEHHIRMGVTGVMLAGTCGEGPWLLDADRETLVRAAASVRRGFGQAMLRRHSTGSCPASPEASKSRNLSRMGDKLATVEHHRMEIREIASRHHARSISVFGSVARGEDRADSDIDFLVDFEPGASLLDLMNVQDDLEALLQSPVDVISAGGLKERDAHIRRESVLV
jgi:predicted nucleotidyltransferase